MTPRTLSQQAEDQAMGAIARGVEAGDPGAMASLYALLQDGRNRGRFLRLFGGQDGQDMVHDCFITATLVIREGRLRCPERLLGFLRGIVNHRIAAGIAGAIRSRRASSPSDDPNLAAVTFGDRSPSPEMILMHAQRCDSASSAIAAGSRIDQEVLDRFYGKEQSTDGICEAMNLTLKQFTLLKSRAIGRARDRMLRRAA